jgi:hypothetical protein
MDFSQYKFEDKREWASKVATFKPDFWQFEFLEVTGKIITLNASPNAISDLIQQIIKLNLLSYGDNQQFELHQNIDLRRVKEGAHYREFDIVEEGLTQEQIDQDQAYDCRQNLSGYNLINHSEPPRRNIIANKLIVNWQPQLSSRLLAFSVNEELQVTIHLNHSGYKDWLHVLQLFKDRYAHFDLMRPRQKIINKFGDCRYFLTKYPIDCHDEEVVHFQFWKTFDIEEPVINLTSYPFVFNEKNEQLLTIRINPRGALEFEAVITQCILQYNQLDYLDYEINCSNFAYEGITQNMRDVDNVFDGLIKHFHKIRFAFLRDKRVEDFYLFSAEYDNDNDIIYFYVSYLQLFKLLDYSSFLQGFNHNLEYIWRQYKWSIPNNLNYENFANLHNCYQFHYSQVVDIQYSTSNAWYKFPQLNSLGCFKLGELFSSYPALTNINYLPLDQKEQDDEYNFFRLKHHSFIINSPYCFMLSRVEKLTSANNN